MSWEQLLGIYRSAGEDVRQLAQEPPWACPNDGEPLETGPDGRLHCKYDGWIWDGQPINVKPLN